MTKFLIILLTSLLSSGPIQFDKTVYDFGKVTVADGPLNATFTLTNNSEEELTILVVVSSCGCTQVSWTKETIQPGGKGEVKATYSNDEGPYPFDKTLSVYTTADKKPLLLHLKGDVIPAKRKK